MQYIKRYLACFLAMTIFIGSVNIGNASNENISEADITFEELQEENHDNLNTILNSEENIQTNSKQTDDTLDNWELGLVFYDSTVDAGKTPLTEIDWYADTTNETRIITIQINYENRNVSKDYQPGELKIRIPNLGQRSVSSGLINTAIADSTGRSYTVAKSISAGSAEFYDWNYELFGENIKEYTNNSLLYGKTINLKYYTDYIFTNNISIEEGSNISGSLQIIYELESKNIFQTTDFNIQASINDEYQSNSLLFNFSSKKQEPFNLNVITESITSFDGMPSYADDYIWIIYRFKGFRVNGVRSFNDFKIKFDLLSSNIKILDNSFKEILLDEKDMHTPSFFYSEATYQCSYYIGYPKSEFENSTINQNFEFWGNYCDNHNMTEFPVTELELINSYKKEQLNINDFKFDYNSVEGTGIKMRINLAATKISYNMLLKSYVITEDANVDIQSPYYGYLYDIKQGLDIVGFKDVNNNFCFLCDDEYSIPTVIIRNPTDYNGNQYKSFNCDLYVRYANEEDYVYYNSYEKMTTINFKEDNIVGYYVYFKDLDKGFKATTFYKLKLQDIVSEIPSEGKIYMFSYVQRYKNLNDEKVLDGNADESMYGSGMQDIIQYDLDKYGNYVRRALSEMPYKDDDYLSIYGVWVNASSLTNNIEKEQIEYTIPLGITFLWWTTRYVEEVNGFKYYILLPEGAQLNATKEEIIETSSCNTTSVAKNFADANSMTVDEFLEYLKSNTSVNIQDNWKNMNRTRVEVIVDLRESPMKFMEGYLKSTNFSFLVKLPLIIPYDSIQEYGNHFIHDTYADAFSHPDYRINYASYTPSTVFTDTLDLNENGNTTERLPGRRFDVSIIQAIASYKDTVSYVKTDKNNYSVGIVESSNNSDYTYKYRVRTGGTNSITNLIIYNNIEQSFGKNDHWNGKFLGIDTSYAESKGYKVKTYYSENTDAGNLYDEAYHINSEYMEYTEATDRSKVKSLAFEFLDSNGNPAVIPSSSLIYVLMNMKAPDNNKISSLAYNRFSATWNELDEWNNIKEQENFKSNIVKVGLPESPKEYGFYILKHEYYVRDKYGNLVLENTVTEEPVEELAEIEIDTSELEHKYINNNKEYKLLEDNVIVIETDNTLDLGKRVGNPR